MSICSNHDAMHFRVQPARILSTIYSQLGKCPILKLSGRPSTEIGILGTSKLYIIRGTTFAFVPNVRLVFVKPLQLTVHFWDEFVELIGSLLQLTFIFKFATVSQQYIFRREWCWNDFPWKSDP